jgi:uncharacterized integral membrane protein
LRRLTWLFGLPFAAIVLVFAVSNRDTVLISFWPLTDGLAMPLFLAVLFPLLVGFLVGSLHQRLKRRRLPPKPPLPVQQ